MHNFNKNKKVNHFIVRASIENYEFAFSCIRIGFVESLQIEGPLGVWKIVRVGDRSLPRALVREACSARPLLGATAPEAPSPHKKYGELLLEVGSCLLLGEGRVVAPPVRISLGRSFCFVLAFINLIFGSRHQIG